MRRDIKPSNLLLRSDGTIKVSDMELARIGNSVAESDIPNRLTGTADFIASEQAIDSHTVDARADIYSHGCTWYFLLTGKPPFTGANVAQKLAKHQTSPVPLVADARPDCPSAMSSLIQRMMAKRPSDRPASAAELLTQLKRMAGSRSPRAELANRPQPEYATGGSDDSSGYGSFDDSGPLREAAVASMPDVGEIDFGNLPPMDLGAMPVASPLSAPPGSDGPRSNSHRKSVSGTDDPNQSVLLGVGLALSIVALLAVVGATIYSVVRDDTPPPTKIKASEDDRGNIIVLGGDR